MIKPLRKRVIGLLIILIAIAVNTGVIATTGFYAEGFLNSVSHNEEKPVVKGDSEFKIGGINDVAQTLSINLWNAYETYYMQLQFGADLAAKVLYRAVSENGDEEITTAGNGFVIKIEGENVQIPDDVSADIAEYALQFKEAKGHIDYPVQTEYGERTDTLVYSKIRGPYYYVEQANGWDMTAYVDQNVNYHGVLEGVEQAFDMGIFIFANDWEHNEFFRSLSDEVVYLSGRDVFGGEEADTELVVSAREDPAPIPRDVMELVAMTPEQRLTLNDRFVSSSQKGKNIRYMVRNLDALDCTAVMAFAEDDAMIMIGEQIEAGMIVILLLSVPFLIWITSVYKEMYNGTSTIKKKEKYSPARVRLITASYGILSALIVFAVSFYNQSLGSIYQENISLGYTLDALGQRLQSLSQEQDFRKEKRKEFYVDYTKRIATLLEEYPEMNNKEDLKDINNVLGSEFIMLFDANGRQVSTSSNYINLELGAENVENPTATADFRRILKGVPSIAHDKEMVEEIGRKLELFGVRTNDKVNGGYGVLIMALDEETYDEFVWDNNVGETMKSLIPQGKLFMAVDRENLISSSSNDDYLHYWFDTLTNKKAEKVRSEGLNDFIEIRGIRHYGITRVFEDDDHLYFACTPNSMLFANGMRTSLIGTICYAAMFLLLAAYLLHGYTEKSLESAAVRQEGAEEQAALNRSRYARAKALVLNRLNCKTPEKKARFVFLLEVALVILTRLKDSFIRNTYEANNYLFSYIMSGQWDKGLNLFALTAAILLLVSIFLLLLAVHFITNTIAAMLNPKGKTICRLISNLISYLGILIFIYFALSYIGIDTRAILASVGVMGIGISMGARGIIADILAGVSTIVEGEYQVGDIVEIDGYRGMVSEIGVRSTKVIGRGGNVKIIGNKNIKNVTNLTKKNSWVAVTIRVDVTYSLTDAEEILAQELPRLGREHKEIISGPIYKGVLAIEGGYAVLSIIAECKEDDFHKVQRILNRGVLLALRNNNVPVR